MSTSDEIAAAAAAAATPEDGAAPEPIAPAATPGRARKRGGAVDDLERQLAEAREAEAAAKDQYLRLAADFENFRRRKAQELSDRSRYASEDAALALLPALDNLRRALESAPAGEPEGLVNGVRMTVAAFDAALERLGITAVEAEGHPFDPALHEAVMAEESADVERDTVVQELQRGYRLHDRLLRPAMVRVVHPTQAVAPAAD